MMISEISLGILHVVSETIQNRKKSGLIMALHFSTSNSTGISLLCLLSHWGLKEHIKRFQY